MAQWKINFKTVNSNGQERTAWLEHRKSIKMSIIKKSEEKRWQWGKCPSKRNPNIFKRSSACLQLRVHECTWRSYDFCPFYLAIVGTLEAEKERRKSGLSSRVQFRNQGAEPKYSKQITLSRQKQKACMEETLWLQVRLAGSQNSFLFFFKRGQGLGIMVACIGFEIYPRNPLFSTKWSAVLEFPSSGYPMLTCISATVQENIRDKLRPIPITASVEIQDPNTRRHVNSLPEVFPILNSNEPKTVHTDVSLSDFFCQRFCHIIMLNQMSLKA